MRFFALLFGIAAFAVLPTYAIDPYQIIESLMEKDQLPRIMNTEDLPDLSPNDPQPLFTPTGDFNKDGQEDVAIAGLYNLPKGSKRYFLLVGTFLAESASSKTFYFKEYTHPIFIHEPGTTGEYDPKDQAFSISMCANCEVGFDFYWNKKSKQFETKPWKAHTRRFTKKEVTPGPEVPQPLVDKALQIVGKLKDVQTFVAQLKKEKKDFGVRVEPETGSVQGPHFRVVLYEKRKGKEILFDKIVVDVEKMQVVKRSKKQSLGSMKKRS